MSESPKDKSALKNYAVYTGIGMSLAFEMGAAAGLGWWLGSLADTRWGIKPWGMLTGIILFVILSMVHIVKTLQRLQSAADDSPGVEP